MNSALLTSRLGKGWSVDTLEKTRRFFLTFSNSATPQRILTEGESSKNDALVELTLPKEANIYAQQYALCLPDKALLQQKLREWIAEFKENEEDKE